MNTRNRDSEQIRRQSPSLLDEVLERRMLFYALAAGAALAGASAAQAKVVFTPSNAVLNGSLNQSSLPIDLNHDGVIDITLNENISSYSLPVLYARGEQSGNLIEKQSPYRFQAALKRGNPVGSGAIFSNSGFMAYGTGPFYHTTNRFLGVKFLINGQVHYGWIGFRSVTKGLKATLGGWAYETEPNTPIIAGDKGTEEADSAALKMAEPTSLELLAMGHTAIADRQRRIAPELGS